MKKDVFTLNPKFLMSVANLQQLPELKNIEIDNTKIDNSFIFIFKIFI